MSQTVFILHNDDNDYMDDNEENFNNDNDINKKTYTSNQSTYIYAF